MRSYLLAGNAAHYDGVIAALEAKGLAVIPAFASGLDARAAIQTFFVENNRPTIDALVSLTGFSLVGGPAYNDSKAAEECLGGAHVPYIAAHTAGVPDARTMERLGPWPDAGETTIMVAIPELDGATGPMVFGGRSEAPGDGGEGAALRVDRDRRRNAWRAAALAELVALRKRKLADRKLAIVLFNFPPNAGSVGSAAFLSVFESLNNTLVAQ